MSSTTLNASFISLLLWHLSSLSGSWLVDAFHLSNNSRRRCKSLNTNLLAKNTATFGMGCFWDPAEELLKVEGVLDTVAGYTGKANAKRPPSYESVCYSNEWVEGVRVQFDDEKISYQDLLEAFFIAQKPKLGSRQYASIIFPHNEEQTRIAEEWIKKHAARQREDGWKVEWTGIEPLPNFFQAEGYHQRYWQKQRPRFAVIVLLLAVSTGVLDSIIPEAFEKTIENVCNGSVVGIGLLIALERFLDSKVVELEQ
eukprot:scaffold1690_cov182-Amphora_coffeaeformis.AAC.22